MQDAKIILVNPPGTKMSEPAAIPCGLLAVGSVLKQEYKNVAIYDLDIKLRKFDLKNETEFYKKTVNEIINSKPDILGITAYSSSLPISLYLAKEIKRLSPKTVIVLGGTQPTHCAFDIVQNFSCIDVVCMGEAENKILNLTKRLLAKECPDDIHGVAFRRQGKIVLSEATGLIGNLDQLPVTDYSLLNLEEYDPRKNRINIAVEAGRGCPFECTFCSTSVMWNRKYRNKSVSRLYQDMVRAVDIFGCEHLVLIHDNFTFDKNYIFEFCQYLIKNGIGFTWMCSSRADHMEDEELLKVMRNAGCSEIYFGVESGSQSIQKIIKKNLKISAVKENLPRVVSNGFNAITSFIIGHLGETLQDLNQTIQLILYLKLNGISVVHIHILVAHNRTALYEAVRNSLFLDETLNMLPVHPNVWNLELGNLIDRHPNMFPSFYQFDRGVVELKQLIFIRDVGSVLLNYYFRTLLISTFYARMPPLQLLLKLYDLKVNFTQNEINILDLKKAIDAVLTCVGQEARLYVNDIIEYEASIYKLLSFSNDECIINQGVYLVGKKIITLKSRIMLKELHYKVDVNNLENMIWHRTRYLFVLDKNSTKADASEYKIEVYEIDSGMSIFIENVFSKNGTADDENKSDIGDSHEQEFIKSLIDNGVISVLERR